MRINAINNKYTAAFKSIRTDKKNIEELKLGENPISDNKRDNILVSLNNLSHNPTRNEIEFLLDVAENLKYGQNGDSEYKDIIDSSTSAGKERENIDWAEELTKTIEAALKNTPEDISDLEYRFKEILGTKKPLTDEQKKVLELRQKFQNSVLNKDTLNDAGSIASRSSILRNIDYFISSSEIPIGQKQKCLEYFIYFLSDEYKIHPQLKDKKIQAAEEMLDDMLIKTPESPILTTKNVDQKYSGICAAISICRKAVAYEDKVRYMEIVMDELQDSPYMTVYDITNLGSDEKIKIPKIKIDYNSAIEQGYRIIDASAHNWMHNAHASGNGTIQTEEYVAFDPETYGVFDDSSWYNGIDPNFLPEKNLLKSLIKEKELYNTVMKLKTQVTTANEKILAENKKSTELLSKINGRINTILTELFPEKSQSDISLIHKELYKFFKGKNGNEINVAEKLQPDVKKQIISDFLKQYTDDDAVKSNIESESGRLLEMLRAKAEEQSRFNKLRSYNSGKGIYRYYRNLYQLAAAHRMSVIADINLEDGVIRYEKRVGLAPRNQQILTYLRQLTGRFASEKVRQNFSSESSKIKSQNELEEELASDIARIGISIPQELENISKTLFDDDIRTLTKKLYINRLEMVKHADNKTIAQIAEIFDVEKDKNHIIKFLNKWIDKLDNSPSDNDMEEAVRTLGFQDEIHMYSIFISQFMSHLKEGISEKEFQELADKFGGKDKVSETINQQIEKFNNIISQYEQIQKKWKVPSAQETIIKKMEKSHSILSEKKLRSLQTRFNYIRKMSGVNEKIQDVREREKANSKLYEFTNEENEIFNEIEKQLKGIKKYCTVGYQDLNNYLFDSLEDQYSYIGMLNGQFWVREEGSSGLSSNEQVRIIEQMTGKPYHIEGNVEEAAKAIKNGGKSGIISYSVDDNSYAFHAQYVPSVTSETFTNPITGAKEVHDVLWTDNSWGKAEKDYFWNGRDGFEYTDYGSGYGWKNGFIISKDMKIGQKVSDIKTATGMDSKDKEPFGLMLDVVMPGMPTSTYQKLYKMFSYILTINEHVNLMNSIEQEIKSGKNISVKYLNGLDDYVEKVTSDLEKKAKAIHSKEDFDKLPEDDYLRFVMEILSLYMTAANPEIADSLLVLENYDELKDIKENIQDDYMEEIGAIFAKSDTCVDIINDGCTEKISNIFKRIAKQSNIELSNEKITEYIMALFYDEDEIAKNDGTLDGLRRYFKVQTDKIGHKVFQNEKDAQLFIAEATNVIMNFINEHIEIKDLNSPILQNSPLYEIIINSIDKYLNPKSDKELLSIIVGLQNCDYDTANKFFEVITAEDLGLNFKHPYEYILKLQQGDSNVYKAFSEIIGTNIISKEISESPLDLSYRDLYIKLAEMDVQKYIKNFKAEAFRKYKLRQAFPQPIIMSDEAIEDAARKLTEYIKMSVWNIQQQSCIINIYGEYEELTDYLKKTEFYQYMMNGKDYEINGENAKNEIEILQALFKHLYPVLQQDSSLAPIAEAAVNLTELLDSSKKVIKGKKVKEEFNKIDGFLRYTDSEDSIAQKQEETKIAEIKDLKANLDQFIIANVDPKYRNEASEIIKELITLEREYSEDEKIKEVQDKFCNFIVEKSIIKNPQSLLKEWIRLLQEGKSETIAYSTISTYLKEALRVAQQTKIQYKLVQNAHEGISSKTQELLSLFNVYLSNGQKESMDSEVGIIYLIEQLKNANDNYLTLNLFLNQSGLSKRAVNAVINNFNIQGSIDLTLEKYAQVTDAIKEINEISKNVDDFTKKSKIPYKSIDDALNHLASYVKRQHKSTDDKILKQYLDAVKEITDVKDKDTGISRNMIMPVALSLNKDIIENITSQINNDIDFIADMINFLDEKMILLEAINIPEDSDEDKRRKAFYSEVEEAQNKIKEQLDKITELIQNSKYILAQYENN